MFFGRGHVSGLGSRLSGFGRGHMQKDVSVAPRACAVALSVMLIQSVKS